MRHTKPLADTPHAPAPSTPAPHPAAATAAPATLTLIGVGSATARYGPHATFLRPDLQPAAPPLDFAESAHGYAQLRQRLPAICQRYGPAHGHLRLDAAGLYADNLLAFLHTLAEPKIISCGDTRRNQNYRAAIFGAQKSDPVESQALARYALTEKPRATPPLSPQRRLLRTLAGRLEAQVRLITRLVNQRHQLRARAFPELALVVKDLTAGGVLELLDGSATAAKVAGARPASLEAIP